MAKETLTVELDSGLVERIRSYSLEHGTDVAQTLGELIAGLPSAGTGDRGEIRIIPGIHRGGAGLRIPEDEEDDVGPGTRRPYGPAALSREDWHHELSPGVRRILGVGAGDADEEDYHRYLMEKYGP